MNGIEKITARIDAEVQAEIERILADARAEADRVAGGYQAQAKAEAAELKAKNEKAAAEREERLVSVAQMEARKAGLGAKPGNGGKGVCPGIGQALLFAGGTVM